jgi:hypothetical protein
LVFVSALQHKLPAFCLQQHHSALVKADVVGLHEVEYAM